MDNGQEQFEALQRLLRVKRHEVPPPGFFDTFPDRVRQRIARGENLDRRPWWERVLVWEPLRPALAGACALAAGGWLLWERGQAPTGAGGIPFNPLSAQVGIDLPPAVRPGPLWTGAEPSSPELASPVDPVPGMLFTPGAGMRGSMSPAATGWRVFPAPAAEALQTSNSLGVAGQTNLGGGLR